MTSDREFQDLEDALRTDEAADPGDAFFREMEAQVMSQVAGRPAPRRSLWARLQQRPLSWLLPAGAVAAAVAVALVVWPWGHRTAVAPAAPEEPNTLSRAVEQKRPAPRPARRAETPGERWLAAHAPRTGLQALDRAGLASLEHMLLGADPMGLLAQGHGDDGVWDPPDEPVTEAALEPLNETELRAVLKTLKRELPGAAKKPRPPMRRPG